MGGDVIRTQPMAVSMGEPAGIGPEVTLKAWLKRREKALERFFVIGDPNYLKLCAELFGLNVPVVEHDLSKPADFNDDALNVVSLGATVKAVPGTMHVDDAKIISGAIVKSVDLVFNGKASAIITAPINKKALYDSGFAYPGHTEFLAGLASEHSGQACTSVMLLAGPQLKTIPVTIHIPLAEVPRQLTTEKIVAVGIIAARDLKSRFGIPDPRLAISGLNPHAGEAGSMGKEDIDVIQPAITQLRALGISVVGPLPADTMFHAGARARYDVAICMYHDQALIPAKTLSFDDGVNVTLGLPFIRTSPDHGTALDIAARGIADPSSMIAAIKMAGDMVKHVAANASESSWS